MSEVEATKKIDRAMLEVAFPSNNPAAAAASDMVLAILHKRYWHGCFIADVEGQQVSIPRRLHFASNVNLPKGHEVQLFVSALQTRSTDGFERQRALGNIIHLSQPWVMPFIVALIGEYVIEILDDIFCALTPELEQVLGAFIVNNPALWDTTKRRVTSYWDVYYRGRGDGQPYIPRADYVGFKIVCRLEMAAHRYRQTAND